MRIGSLFSGIGGLELGLELSGVGHTVWQVEQDEYCRQVLARHWPDVVRYDNVVTVGGGNLAPVDLICGGFPCQDVSSAGARAGLAGRRSGLWSEFARIVAEAKPRWVVVENVTSGAKLWVDAVRAELERQGYETLPVPLQADWLGAPYRRARVFVVAGLADADRDGQPAIPIDGEVAVAPQTSGAPSKAWPIADADCDPLRKQPRGRGGADREGAAVNRLDRWCEPMPPVGGVVPGLAYRVAARRAGGNCVVPAMAEVIGHIIKELDSYE